MKFLKEKHVLLYLAFGLLIRLLVMPFTFHWDLKDIAFGSHLPYWGYGTQVYDFLSSLSPFHPFAETYGRGVLTYPPLLLFSFGLILFLLSPLLGASFSSWLFTGHEATLVTPYIFRYLFLMKLPFLFFDLMLGLLLISLFTQQRERLRAWKLWMLNPVSLYVTFMIGQFDVVPTFFLLSSIFFVLKRKSGLAGLFLGIGGALKLFPFFFLPFFLFSFSSWRERLRFLIGSLGLPILLFLPFLSSPYFRTFVLTSTQSQRMFEASIPLYGQETLLVFVVIYTFILIRFFEERKRAEFLPTAIFCVILAFLSLSHFHSQWFLWIVPFLVWLLTKKMHMPFVYTLSVLFFILAFFFESSLTWGLFAPITPLLNGVPGVAELMDRIYPSQVVVSVFRSAFLAVATILGWRVIHEKNLRFG